ncbi:MAG: WD40 repeat domain-containing protein [Planctomycetota bacterium]
MGYVRDFTFSSNGRSMAALRGGAILVWNTGTWKIDHTLEGHEEGTAAVAFHPAGAFLASTGRNGELWIWDVKSEKVVRKLDAGPGGGTHVAWTPDGRRIIAPCVDGEVRVFGVK